MKLLLTIIIVLVQLLTAQSQTLITLDFATNTIKRATIEGDSLLKNKRIDSKILLNEFIKKDINQHFQLKDVRYDRVLKKRLAVGDYLIFEITNFGENTNADSIFVSYNFLDRHTQNSSAFSNILNQGLASFTKDKTSSESTNKETVQTKDKIDDTTSAQGRFPASQDDIGRPAQNSNSELLPYYYLLDFYSKSSDSSILYLARTLNDTIGLIRNIESLIQITYETETSDSLELHLYLKALNESLLSISDLGESLNGLLNQGFTQAEIDIYVQHSLEQYQIKKNKSTAKSPETRASTSRILGVDTSSKNMIFAPLQIPNKDRTFIYLEAYKNSKKVYERSLVFHNKNGFKVDFSIGFTASFLKDFAYSLLPSQDTTFLSNNGTLTDTISSINSINKIIEVDDGNFFVGAGLMAHFYTRWEKGFNIAASPGFILNSDSRINYLLGLSLIFGHDQRIILSAGGAWGRIKKLSEIYEVGQIIPASITEIPTRDVWKSGFFIGLSYNL